MIYIWALRQLRCRRALRGSAFRLHCSTTPTQRSCFGESLKMLSHFFNAPYVPQQPYRAAPTIPNAFLFFLHPAKTSQSHFLDLQALSSGINRMYRCKKVQCHL